MKFFFPSLLMPILISSAFAFDWQGHRGARGLYPENTIGSMQTALNYPVTTLELDVVVSGDEQVVVSHEPWMNPEICTAPGRKKIPGSKKVNLHELTYDQIKKYDCGSMGNPHFPKQRKVSVGKPLLADLIKTLEEDLKQQERPGIRYNIEIKSSPENEQKGFQPPYKMFTDLVANTILKQLPHERFSIQSFDWRVLKYLKSNYPKIQLVALRDEAFRPEEVIADLGFVPAVFSPQWKLVTARDVKFFHSKGAKVIPWTVNEVADMKQVKALGVDGIITDYPNLIAEVEGIQCPAGTNLFEGQCVKIPENARPSDKNPGWVCESGFQQKRSSCEKIILPANAHLLKDGKTWVCNQGFIRYKASCKKNSKKK